MSVNTLSISIHTVNRHRQNILSKLCASNSVEACRIAKYKSDDPTAVIGNLLHNRNTIGILPKSGRYGGTYAYKDIAFKFANWISVEFELYIMKVFQRLKNQRTKIARLVH